ncbi:NB-ARC domain-containing protein, partial [Vibrio parahaemolyticus]
MDILKRVFIKKVVDDLIPLNGTEFEYLCKPIFDILVGEQSIHKGSNLYAKPISRTVDFSTNNFEVVGQCGTDGDYFDVFSRKFDELIKLKLSNTKPIKDIKSTLNNSHQCSKIILFANQEAKGGRLDNVNKVIRHIGIKQDVDIIDSEKIAEIIFDNIGNQKLVLSLIDYLPTASQIYSAISMHNELPPLPSDFVVRKDEKSIIDIVRDNQVSAIHGVSGIGKSKVALGVAHKLSEEFDSVIWVNLDEGKTFNFKSVKVGDFDKNLNLANLCETYKTLVILDNFFGNADELKSNFSSFANSDSRVIITSIERSLSRKSSFHLSEMDEEESRALISSHINIDDKHIEAFISNIGGHPLCLELVCQIIEDEEYDEDEIKEFIQEIEQIPEEIVKGRSQSISDLVIGKHSDRLSREFTLLSLLNSQQVSNYVLNKILGKRSIRNLEKSSLIVRSGINFSTIHSIVLLSINNLFSTSKEKDVFKNEICDLLLVENEFKRSDYYSFCVMHHELLRTLYQCDLSENRRKALLYAIIQTTDN